MVSVFSIAKGKSYSGLLRQCDDRILPPPMASFLCHGTQCSPVWRFGFSGIIWSLEGVVRRKMNPQNISALIPMTCVHTLHYMAQGTFQVWLKILRWGGDLHCPDESNVITASLYEEDQEGQNQRNRCDDKSSRRDEKLLLCWLRRWRKTPRAPLLSERNWGMWAAGWPGTRFSPGASSRSAALPTSQLSLSTMQTGRLTSAIFGK